MLLSESKQSIESFFHCADMKGALEIATDILHQTYNVAPITAEQEIMTISRKPAVTETITGF